MSEQEQQMQVYLHSQALKGPHEILTQAELANRLSNAIIETVVEKKSQGWEMVKMEFAAGSVTLQFKRPQPL
jgi:hypothetical protein